VPSACVQLLIIHPVHIFVHLLGASDEGDGAVAATATVHPASQVTATIATATHAVDGIIFPHALHEVRALVVGHNIYPSPPLPELLCPRDPMSVGGSTGSWP